MSDLSYILIRRDEGEKRLPYQDSLGIWTIADGHNLVANGLPRGICQDAPDGMPWPECKDFLVKRGGLSDIEMKALYDFDLKANCSWLWVKPWWPAVSPERQAALNDFGFNLGFVRAQQFGTFLGLIAVGDYQAAAADLLNNTAVAKELPTRYGRLAKIIESGTFPAGLV